MNGIPHSLVKSRHEKGLRMKLDFPKKLVHIQSSYCFSVSQDSQCYRMISLEEECFWKARTIKARVSSLGEMKGGFQL